MIFIENLFPHGVHIVSIKYINYYASASVGFRSRVYVASGLISLLRCPRGYMNTKLFSSAYNYHTYYMSNSARVNILYQTDLFPTLLVYNLRLFAYLKVFNGR